MMEKGKEITVRVEHLLIVAVKIVCVSFTLAVGWFVLFSLVVDSDIQKRLSRENELYERLVPEMEYREKLISDVILSLQEKDNDTYRNIFGADAPSMDPGKNLELFSQEDTIPDSGFQKYVAKKSDALLKRAGSIESNFKEILRVCSFGPDSLPPLTLPLENVSYAQIGASVGIRVNPFYKVGVQHGGLDIIASRGDAVLASADGVVSAVTLSKKGLGNVVEITHPAGYVTRYCHLADVGVKRGQKVLRGQTIATVGISGTLYAPHLHYEVLLRGRQCDPVNFFFASVTPDEYTNMVYMSGSTTSSLD